MDTRRATRSASPAKPSAGSKSRPGLLKAAALVAASGAVARRSASAKAMSVRSHESRPYESRSHEPSSPREAQKHEAGAGRDAQAPQDIPAAGWTEIFSRVYEQVGKDRVLAVAAGVAFYALLSVFPMIAAFVSLYGLVADPASISAHLEAMSGILPGGAVEVIGEQVKRISSQPRGTLGFSFALGLGIALWSANSGVKALFDALNVAYNEEEKRSFLALNAQSLAFTLAALVGAALALGALVIVPAAINLLGLGDTIGWVLSLARWPVLLLLVVAGLAALYRFGPSREAPQWRWLSPGSIFAALVWLVASMAFSWYAANFGSYNETYGSLGAAIGFMIWLWISAAIVLLGAEVNAEADRQTAHDTTQGAPEPMGQRGAFVADSVAS